MGKGTVELKFTSIKMVTLIEVLHVSDIRKNLVSCTLLYSHDFKIILRQKNLFLSKLVRKCYATNGMFKLNIENKNIFAYVVESLDL